MDFEVNGLVNHSDTSVGGPPPPVDFDLGHIQRSAKVQEEAGYDRVLIANAATMPDSFIVGGYLSPLTTKLGFMMAHRPGFVAPTMAARMLGALDRVSQGRAAVHIIAGADDRELQKDGDFLTKDQRYHRAAEYVQVMRKVWSSPEPFDHKGEFYTFNQAFSSIRPKAGAIHVYWGGTSDLALDTCGQWADTYAMGGDTLEGAGELASKAHAAAARHGRHISVLMTIVCIVEPTEAQAWARADELLQRVEAKLAANPDAGAILAKSKEGEKLASGGFQRLLERSKQGDRLDKILWTGLNRAFGGRGNNSVLVGTAEQVVDSLMDYRALGITRFLLRGPSPNSDATIIGRDVIPLLRQRAMEREAAAAKTSAA